VKRSLALVGTLAATAGLMVGVAASPLANASSHREAPMIAQDPAADLTDVYAFVSPDKPDTVTLIANVWPFADPMGGPNFFQFDPKARYNINVSTDGGADADITYRLEFQTTVKNGNTFLYNTGPFSMVGDANLNVEQTATVTKVEDGNETVIASGVPVAPAYIGPRSNPQGVDANAHIREMQGGEGSVFAGLRGDPFFVDLGVFDVLGLRNPGSNTLQGFDVLSMALQVPASKLTTDGQMPAEDGSNAIIGVWSTVERRSTRVLNDNGTSADSGDWVQVSRLGQPLVNEVVVPVGAKDLFNASKPSGDTQFLGGVTDPELPKLLKALYNVDSPTAPRNDLVTIFLTGIPGLNQPANVVPSEMLRLNMSIKPVGPAGSGARMGLLAGETAGFPNGRRLEDDVVDIAFQAMAGATPFTPDFNKAPNNTLGDSVNESGQEFNSSFPYLSASYMGWDHTHHTP
jgi:hypothetical protein